MSLAAPVRGPLLWAGTLLGLLLPSACAPVPSASCPPGKERVFDETLYLGTGMPGGVVSEEQWRSFVRSEIEPRFPGGFTVMIGNGQWRDSSGQTVRETAYILRIVHAPEPSSDRAVGEIVAAYRMRFEQESILRVSAEACASW